MDAVHLNLSSGKRKKEKRGGRIEEEEKTPRQCDLNFAQEWVWSSMRRLKKRYIIVRIRQ